MYCGLRAARSDLLRYRMAQEEILDSAHAAGHSGCGTVVMQAGEDPALTKDWIADVVREIRRREPGLAITLSLASEPTMSFVHGKDAGADRYLLRFETSNREYYDHIHPPAPGRRSDRLAILRTLRELGYQSGSGRDDRHSGQSWADSHTM